MYSCLKFKLIRRRKQDTAEQLELIFKHFGGKEGITGAVCVSHWISAPSFCIRIVMGACEPLWHWPLSQDVNSISRGAARRHFSQTWASPSPPLSNGVDLMHPPSLFSPHRAHSLRAGPREELVWNDKRWEEGSWGEELCFFFYKEFEVLFEFKQMMHKDYLGLVKMCI